MPRITTRSRRSTAAALLLITAALTAGTAAAPANASVAHPTAQADPNVYHFQVHDGIKSLDFDDQRGTHFCWNRALPSDGDTINVSLPFHTDFVVTGAYDRNCKVFLTGAHGDGATYAVGNLRPWDAARNFIVHWWGIKAAS
jgi:hypothetical protein